MDRFPHPTFVVLDVPSPIAETVHEVRVANGLPATEPVTITVAGSSGVGVFAASQVPTLVYRFLDELATRWAPIQAQFSSVHRFPNTDIYVLRLRDEAPFGKLHAAVTSGPLNFKPSPFPYTPHCTVRASPLASGQTGVRVPDSVMSERFALRCLSVYGWHKPDGRDLECPLYHRVQLGAA